MKKTVLLLFLNFSVITINAQTAPTKADDDRGYIVKVGDLAPDNFSLKLTNGKTTTLKELHGKVVVLQFTASWCSVCRTEMPHLQKDVWEANQNKDLVLIGVDRDERLDKVQKFHADMKITYPLALDPGADIFGLFADKKSGVTRNVVIGRDGRIAFLTRLYSPTEFTAMVKVIDGLLANTSASAN
ncbi:TlpA family protein disulfide reductase [Mucilaginibacter paludis]|uniref:Alkyl hydroperoxide reductase/ Thiol specific antioxidant/ Mal allergen n=1 Tax=Mucilaginibacter paludis DSM 18603 TaxID=714943 RepID=H1Y726_9SPHI|nr:TlpA disulfide reductase family protein [Mucilaginibacter paludis]EHQ28645.1 alkyl hydroperoxide reductase/ Thiol specific antioxidant/ Mal allergen [Mucilaginibacter paludis DSM 18603]